MEIVIAVIFVAVALAIGGAIVLAIRGSTREQTAPPGPPPRPRPALVDFHVREGAAHVYFAVPLGSVVSEHLQHVLEAEGIAVLREKRDHGLPLSDVDHVVVYGQRAGEPIGVSRVALPDGEALPEVVVPELVPHAGVAGYDPLARLGESDLGVTPGLDDGGGEGALPPVMDVVELTVPLEAALRAQGIDPAESSLGDLALTLLRLGGYDLSLRQSGFRSPQAEHADVYEASAGGRRSLVAIVEHRPGEYPELSEAAVNEAVLAAVQLGVDSAFLITDKYGPYLIYEKERNGPCRFITRERLQSFVDSFALR